MIDYRITPVSIREVVHVVMLRELVRRIGADSFVLKGGVNLRLYFASVRYSQDMDLDGEPSLAHQIRDVIGGFFASREVGELLRQVGIRELDPGEGPNKDTETTFRHKFHIVGAGSIRYSTKVEVSYRDRHPDDDSMVDPVANETIVKYLPDEQVEVRHYLRVPALRQKIAALAGRATPQTRDVFDIYMLLRGALETVPHARLRTVLRDDQLDEAMSHAYQLTYEGFQGQVLEFLDDEDVSRFDSAEEWDEIRLETIDFIEKIAATEAGG